jgi:hypothetical protein
MKLGKWMELEIVILSEVRQIQKDKGHIFSHTWNPNLKNKCIHKARCQWLTAVNLAIQEAENRKIMVQSHPKHIVRETLSQKNPTLILLKTEYKQ